ncbi:hypothetical protein AAHC03_09070 [Spirometra sp. Aus1]
MNGCWTFIKAEQELDFHGFQGHVQRKLPEMRADLVVPADLDSCELKPYVAWRANVVDEPPVNSESLFKIRYAEEIKRLHDEGVNKADILKKI